MEQPEEFSSLHSLLNRQSERFGDRLAYTFQGNDGDTSLSFAELNRRARAIAHQLTKRTQPGDRVLLLFPAGLDFIAAFFGCLYAKVLAVPTTYPKPRRPMPRLTAIARECGAVAALTTEDTVSTLDQTITASDLPDMDWIAVESIDEAAADEFADVDCGSDDLAFLQFTSGSTSDPKGVMVSHGNLLHNLEMIRQGFGIQLSDDPNQISTGVFWLPAYHDMGLIGGILESLYVGGHSTLMSPAAFLQRPMGWLETLSETQASISGAPNFAYELCASRATEEQCKSLDLRKWRLAFCGAEPIRFDTLRQFAERFRISGFSANAFYPCYGLAEGTLLAAGNLGPQPLVVKEVRRDAMEQHQVKLVDQSQPTLDTLTVVGCGGPLLDQKIRIVDPHTLTECSPQSVGEVWVHGKSIAQGYWNRPDETAETFHATLGDDPSKTFLRTGDLGFVLDGNLFVTGRVKDILIIRGRNHYPQDVERSVAGAHEALRSDGGAVFAIEFEGTEQLVAVQEVDRKYRQADFDEVIRHVRRNVSADHDLELHGVVLIRPASLPRTTSGKPQRHLAKKLFEDGQLRVMAEWNREQQRAKLREAAAKNGADAKTGLPQRLEKSSEPLTPDEIDRLAERVESWLLTWLVERAAIPAAEVNRDKPFAEYGLDSLTAVELSQELEDWLGVEVVPTVAWNYPTPATLSKYLAGQAGGQSDTGEDASEAAAVPVDDEFDKLLAEIESMSDDEIQSGLDP